MVPPPTPSHSVGRGLEVVLCTACGIAMGSAYNVQGVLAGVASSLGLPTSQVGILPAATQLGLWIGVLALLPLGDLMEGRRLVVLALSANVMALALVGLSATGTQLTLACLLVGATTIVPYLLPPLASRLTDSEQRSAVLARMTAAVFSGIVISRASAVYFTELMSWRAPFWISAALCAIAAMGLYKALPALPPASAGRYGELLSSLAAVFREQRPLREAALNQGLQFASFNMFWIVLPLFLAGPAHRLGSGEISLFSALGLAGVLVIPALVRWVDRVGNTWTSLAGAAAVALAWTLGGLLQMECWWLAAGGVLMNFGVAASHIANQASIFALCPGARSRLAALYAMGTFTGGIVAAPLATWVWSHHGWRMVCLVGAILAWITVLLHVGRVQRCLHDRRASLDGSLDP